ncbi:MAG: hypothetical protein O7H41_17510 [Planctomycetota bacterium]|nr:hypothetical protein [Planctomycetota bacterium]
MSLIDKTSQITTTLDSPRGSFTFLVSALAKNHIRMRAFQLDGDRARIVVDDPDLALAALREVGIEAWVGEVIVVETSSDPDALEAILLDLKDAGVEIAAACTAPTDSGTGLRTYLTVSDLEAAMRATSK